MSNYQADRYVIQSISEKEDYWSNEFGWVGLDSANVFDALDVVTLHLPLGGRWMLLKPYSILLLYPDYLNDTGCETYYAFVKAPEALDAVALAQRQAAAAQSVEIDDPADFAPLLVTEGHHASEPLFNK